VAVTVLLADDHAIVSQGLEALLRPRFDVVGHVRDGRALVAAAETLSPDVVVTDISMPGLNGLEAIRQIKKSKPGIVTIVLTMHTEPTVVSEALKAGASGYVVKTSAVEELGTAVQEALKGRTYITPLLATDLFSLLIEGASSGSDRLTPRQREVLQLIAEGRTMKEVATILSISPRTAESHKYDMMEVLGCKTTADLIHHAINMNMVSP